MNSANSGIYAKPRKGKDFLSPLAVAGSTIGFLEEIVPEESSVSFLCIK